MLTSITCLTPGAWSSAIVQVMVVSAVLRATVAVRIDLESKVVVGAAEETCPDSGSDI